MTSRTPWLPGRRLLRQLRRAGCMLGTLMVCASPVAAAEYALVEWDGSLPGDAVAAGSDSSGATLYVCVASGWGGHHPGSLGADGRCLVAWGGQQHEFDGDFQVLVGGTAPEGTWQDMPDGGVPGGAFPAGGDDSGPLLVCRVAAWGGTFPGKLTEAGWCYVAHDGDEHYFTSDYEVLVE